MDQDGSEKISEAEFAAAYRIVAEVSAEFLPASIGELDGNKDGEVDRAEWDQRMDAAVRALGPEAFVDVCARSLQSYSFCGRGYRWVGMR